MSDERKYVIIVGVVIACGGLFILEPKHEDDCMLKASQIDAELIRQNIRLSKELPGLELMDIPAFDKLHGFDKPNSEEAKRNDYCIFKRSTWEELQ